MNEEKNSTDIYQQTVNEFAIKQGYEGARYIGNWKEYRVYEPYLTNDKVSFIGLPLVILVQENGEIRMSTSEETLACCEI